MISAFSMLSNILLLSTILWMTPAMAADALVTGSYQNSECISCHEKDNSLLISEWRSGSHGKAAVDCVACHGTDHQQSTVRARENHSCNQCHGGEEGSVSHSYSTSKHGIIVRLEAAEYDRSKPLTAENYRAPSCAFCHFFGGHHNVSQSMSQKKSAADDQEARQQMRWVCRQCHAPRYIRELETNGRKMLALGEMKLLEAAAVVELARSEFPAEQLTQIEMLYHTMQSETIKALRVGIAHQSPDYQWWHGHPALDGKLLRIKGALTDLRRKRALVKTQ
ncbi:MAG: hypothetical protein OEL79_06520 [Chromatiales bacterium]|nr:hypothetical protein [Chromatiales bacterium]